MKISKQDSNYEVEISAEEITSLSGLLKNDNAMELVSGILRYFQVQTERARWEQSVKEMEELKIEETAKVYVKEDKTLSMDNQANKSEDNDLEYFVGVPSSGS